MGITITAPQEALRSLGAFTVVADGTEQTLVDQGEGPTRVMGYIDLSLMLGGDTVLVRHYVKVKSGGAWVCYAGETYTGVQAVPLVYITEKPANHGLKVSLQQTAGVFKAFDCEFLEEV
ncbi:MAG: hypothetical protein V1924_05015 [Candidatus Bathyarchaeota archaeon]